MNTRLRFAAYARYGADLTRITSSLGRPEYRLRRALSALGTLDADYPPDTYGRRALDSFADRYLKHCQRTKS